MTTEFEISSENEDSKYSDSPMRLQGSSASSASVASRLYGGRSRRDSLGGSSSESDLIAFHTDPDNIDEFNNKMSTFTSMTKRQSELEDRNMMLADEKSRLKTECAILKDRVHMLEEQMSDKEDRYKELLQDEKNRTADTMKRLRMEKEMDDERWRFKCEQLEKEAVSARKDLERANEEVKRVKNELEKTLVKLEESQLLIEGMEDERIKLERQFKKFKEDAQQDIDSSSEMVEVLTMETEELRRKNGRTGSVAEQLTDMEEELEMLREKVKELANDKEQLNDQLLATSVESGQKLLADAPSLADELAGGDTKQLLNALREQEICNQKLRVYINGILMRVIERHPEILEINEEDSSSSSPSS